MNIRKVRNIFWKPKGKLFRGKWNSVEDVLNFVYIMNDGYGKGFGPYTISDKRSIYFFLDSKENGYLLFDELCMQKNGEMVVDNLRLSVNGLLLLQETKDRKVLNKILIGILITILATIIIYIFKQIFNK